MDFVVDQLLKCTQGPGIKGLVYFLSNFFFIKTKEAGFKPIYPFWDSQLMLLERIDAKWLKTQSVWFLILKARQLGISTVIEGILLWLTIFNKNWTSLLLADEPHQTEYIFEMARNGYESLPWWMRPEKRYDVKGHHIIFDRQNEEDRIKRPGLKSQILAESANQRSGAAYGKAQSLTAKVLTPSGWLLMGDIEVGSSVISGDGSVTTVTGVYPQGPIPMFRVTFSDGASTECCDEHLWLTQTGRERKEAERQRRGSKRQKLTAPSDPKVRTLSEVRETLISRGKRNHTIPMVGDVQFNARLVPLQPYLLGVLLGDGSFTAHQVGLTSEDPEILHACAVEAPPGTRLKHLGGISYHIAGTRDGGQTPNSCLVALKELGLRGLLSNRKFVPDAYKYNVKDVRLAVIRGLMDTDGDVHQNGMSAYYTTTSERLAEDMKFLVNSLGGVASINLDNNRTYSYKGVKLRGKLAYRMAITLPRGVCPFNLRRKAESYRPRRANLGPRRYIQSIEPIGLKPAQCITVDHPSRLYVTDDFIVTHNTLLALHASEVPKYKDARVLTEGVLPTMPENNPHVVAFLEGAAQKRHDDWHRMWKASEAGLMRFEPVFIPWFGERQYFAPPTAGWIPQKETAALSIAIQREYDKTLLDGQLFWYERKRNDYLSFEGDDSTFLTQFPSNAQEAFQNAGICAFSKRKLHMMNLIYGSTKCWTGEIRLADNNVQPKLSFVEDGRLKIWQFPSIARRNDATAKFYVSGDPSGGTASGHPAAWQVLMLPSSPFDPVVQVACWKGHAGPSQFARIGAALGYLYDSAELCPESNNMGATVVSDLKNVLNYPYLYRWRREDKAKGYFSDFYGWLMTRQSKGALIARMAEGIDEDMVILRDPGTIDEFYDFISEDGEEYHAVTEDGHGDLAIAAMIGYYCAFQNRPLKERSEERMEYQNQRRDKTRDFVNTEFSPDHDKGNEGDAPQTEFMCL